MTLSNEHFDLVVVGAGASGAVMAARLSEDAGCRVLLIEAGVDYASEAQLPAALLDPNEPVSSGHNWHIPAKVREAGVLANLKLVGSTLMHSRIADQARMVQSSLAGGVGQAIAGFSSFDYNVGKVVGGSTAVNGALAIRGTAGDYDEWAAFSGQRWNAERAQRAFEALESHEGDMSSAAHPLPIRQERREELTPIQAAFCEASEQAGYPLLQAQAPAPARGVSLVRKAVRHGQRMSTARSHLAVARSRSNFDLLSQAHVDRLIWADGNRCSGVEVIVGGARRQISADRVVLCAGTLNTPSILMRSGVGAPELLKRAQVHTRLALRGVGQNLVDHAVVGLWAVPKPGSSRLGEPTHQAYLRLDGAERKDLHLYMLGGIRTESFPMLRTALGSELGIALAPCLMKPRSRGHCRIVSSDPLAAPEVSVNCLADPVDARLIRDGVRQAWALLQAPSMRPHIDRILTWNAQLLERESALDSAIAVFVRPGWHVVGTARMGPASDPDAVVDASGRVHGTEQLWIVDASIMPTVPSVPPALSCMMLAEELSREMRG